MIAARSGHLVSVAAAPCAYRQIVGQRTVLPKSIKKVAKILRWFGRQERCYALAIEAVDLTSTKLAVTTCGLMGAASRGNSIGGLSKKQTWMIVAHLFSR
jgi:hypothetical protein